MCGAGRADDHRRDGGARQCAVPRPRARHVDAACLPVAAGPVAVVRRPPAAHQGAGDVDDRLPAARLRLARRLLQPAVVPHRHHAADGAQGNGLLTEPRALSGLVAVTGLTVDLTFSAGGVTGYSRTYQIENDLLRFTYSVFRFILYTLFSTRAHPI